MNENKWHNQDCLFLAVNWRGRNAPAISCQVSGKASPTGKAFPRAEPWPALLVLTLNSPTLNIASKPKRSEYEHKLLNQCILEQTLNIAGKPKRNKRRHKHLNQYILEQAYNCSRKICLPAWLLGEPLEWTGKKMRCSMLVPLWR